MEIITDEDGRRYRLTKTRMTEIGTFYGRGAWWIEFKDIHRTRKDEVDRSNAKIGQISVRLRAVGRPLTTYVRVRVGFRAPFIGCRKFSPEEYAKFKAAWNLVKRKATESEADNGK